MSHEYEEQQVEKWVNLEDVAEHLSISQDTVRTWIKEGKLPVYRAGKRYKFKISEVDEWVREGKIQELTMTDGGDTDEWQDSIGDYGHQTQQGYFF